MWKRQEIQKVLQAMKETVIFGWNLPDGWGYFRFPGTVEFYLGENFKGGIPVPYGPQPLDWWKQQVEAITGPLPCGKASPCI